MQLNHPTPEHVIRSILSTQKQVAAAAWKLANPNSCSAVANQPGVGRSAVRTRVEHHGKILCKIKT